MRWLTAAEIAAARLPGMPTDRTNIWRLAKRDCWNGRRRGGSKGGGGFEYPETYLTAGQRTALAEHESRAKAGNRIDRESARVERDGPASRLIRAGGCPEANVSRGVTAGKDRRSFPSTFENAPLTPAPVSGAGFDNSRPERPAPVSGAGFDNSRPERPAPVSGAGFDNPRPERPPALSPRGVERVAFLDVDGPAKPNHDERERQAWAPDISLYMGTSTRQTRADARIAILDALEAFRTARGLGITEARRGFAAAYNAHAIAEIDAWVREAVPSVSAGSLARWGRAAETGGAAALAGRYGNRRGAGRIARDADTQDLIVAMIEHRPSVSAKQVMRALRVRIGRNDLPSYRTVQRFMAAWKEAHRRDLMVVTNPDKARSHFQVAMGSRSEAVTRLNQVWEMDSTPADVMLKGGRHAVIGVIDVYSRRAKLLVAKTSNAAAISALLRRAILDWGAPETIHTDQGSDYTSHHMRRVLRDLDIAHEACAPFQPQRKPFIERFFGTLTRGFFEQLPGYIGHDVAERSAIESRTSFGARLGEDRATLFAVDLTAEEFQARCDTWCDALYGRDAHAGLNGRSPFAVAAAWAEPVRRIEDERALDVLFAEAPGEGFRNVTKKGIRLDNTTFFSPVLATMVGERVHVRYDEADLGRIFAFDAESGEFLCTAESPERLGVDRREAIRAAHEAQREADRQVRADARRRKAAIKPETVIEDVLRAATEDAGQVIAFPARAESHESVGIDEAIRAAARPTFTPPAPDPAMDAARARLAAEIAEASRKPEDDRDRIKRALSLEAREAAGESLGANEARWLKGYQTTAEYRAGMDFVAFQKEFYETHGANRAVSA